MRREYGTSVESRPVGGIALGVHRVSPLLVGMAPHIRKALYGDDGVLHRCASRCYAIRIRLLGVRAKSKLKRERWDRRYLRLPRERDKQRTGRQSSGFEDRPLPGRPGVRLMNMTRTSQIRHECFYRQCAVNSPIPRMCVSGSGFAAYPTRHGAVESPVCPDCVLFVTTHGSMLVCETNRHPRRLHRVTRCDGLNLCLISRSAQAPLWAYPSPWRHGAALLSGLLSQSKFGPLLQKARLGLGSRALREAPPGVP
jgi:hypothetical protein